ncbi:hypothetical protein DL95DRAFT_487147 [Leptodontidium sp. 2 PMI_412]|nr:hypothetical protein DL95DRAFT_487147 [Leptodontidium sp. 2 PMI_412]
MESVQPPARPTGLDNSHGGDGILTRPRASSERDLMRSSMSIQRPDENRSPANFSRACESMLKTTTETGDIGMFSIKPLRLPQSLGTPRRLAAGYNPEIGHQKPRQNFQPYGVPVVDDRRRLPSYARDAASEVISMYESASQKSASRVFDEPDYRSYSMTQTSYSSYTLSNHRSYNSLRSQADANTQVQRPRSPFAYPARLKRPGFRPSSPALTDGGIVDYSRRAEIERIPQGVGHGTSSPSSLYAQRRRPHQSLRPDANRSTPSLLSQSSPPRRSSSPLVSRSNGISSYDWARRPGPASVNTSPARSTFSLASTVNLYASAQPPPTTTTPGKVPPPSPLYYDYTEDFEVEVYNEPATMEPPPPFRIDKTIPEDRPMSSERPLSMGPGSDDSYNALQALLPGRSVPLKCIQDKQPDHNALESKEEALAVQPTPTDTDATSSGDRSSISRDRKSVRLSGLGYGAQQLRSHVDEAFGNFPSSALEITDPNKQENSSVAESRNDQALSESLGKDAELPSARSSYSIITSIPHFPSPPNAQDISQSKDAADTASGKAAAGPFLKSSGSQEPVQDSSPPTKPSLTTQHQQIDANHSDSLKSHSRTLDKMRLSEYKPFGVVIPEPAEHINAIEAGNRHRSAQENQAVLKSVRRTPMTSPTVPEGFKLRKADTDHDHTPQMSLFNRRRAADSQRAPQIQPLKRSQYYGGRRLDLSSISDQEAPNVPNFSHQIPKKDMPRSESPMLAPKPISPARQLKLKNSVPQLMKALPPLPPEPSSRPGSPTSQLESEEIELPCKFSPLERDLGTNPIQIKPKVPAKTVLPKSTLSIENDKKVEPKTVGVVPTITATEDIVSLAGDSESSLPPPRMKLKVKSSGSQRPTSPPDSRPRNLAENYPWSSQTPSVRLPLVVPDPQVSLSKPPRFKLKVTRASNSTQGTIRVNRDSGESKSIAGLHLRNPKDLFTPSTGIDNIFRQVSRHLHSRKASMASSHADQIDTNLPSSSISNSTSTPNPPDPDFTQLPPVSVNPLGTSEARSVFSDDSSHVHGNHSLRLRGRLSNLRAKIAAPYANRAGTQSHDDITWRDRHGAEAPIPSATRSIPDLHSNRKSTDSVRPVRRWVEKARRQKLKAKVHVQGWLKEAKSAIVTRVRTRSNTGDGGNSNDIKD